MDKKVEEYVTKYFNECVGVSFLITEVMDLYLSTEQDEVKLGCLELLYKMK